MTCSFGTCDFPLIARQRVALAVEQNRVSYGPFLRDFERRMAELHGVRHAVFMSSGTCALEVGLVAAKETFGWPNGSEVIIPATTFIATMSTVIRAGLHPVLADVSLHNFNLTLSPELVSAKTVAVLPVHLLGEPCNMAEIVGFANEHRLHVIEDCCEAVGVSFGGKPVGSFGLFGAVSTYVCHHVTSGVGGAVLTNDDGFATLCRSLMQHGRHPDYLKMEDDDRLPDSEIERIIRNRYRFERFGFSYRLTEMEGALGVSEMERGERHAAMRRTVASWLFGQLYTLMPQSLSPHCFSGDAVPLFYPLVTVGPAMPLMVHLERNGVETRPLMPLLNQPPVIAYRAEHGDTRRFPNSEWLLDHGILVGCHPGMTEDDCARVGALVKEFYT